MNDGTLMQGQSVWMRIKGDIFIDGVPHAADIVVKLIEEIDEDDQERYMYAIEGTIQEDGASVSLTGELELDEVSYGDITISLSQADEIEDNTAEALRNRPAERSGTDIMTAHMADQRDEANVPPAARDSY